MNGYHNMSDLRVPEDESIIPSDNNSGSISSNNNNALDDYDYQKNTTGEESSEHDSRSNEKRYVYLFVAIILLF